MKTSWDLEMCAEMPSQFERLNESTWIQRKDIKKAEKKEGEREQGTEGYTCMSRFISNDVYETIAESCESPVYEKILQIEELNEASNAQIMLDQATMQEAQAEQEEVLAEILLNTTTIEEDKANV